MPTKKIVILDNEKVEFGITDAVKPVERKVCVSWNKNTEIQNAKLWVRWISPISAMCTDIYWNGDKVMDFYCGWGSCDFTKETDITTLLKNGVNNVKFAVWKCPMWHPWATTITITAHLYITYVGEPPKVVTFDVNKVILAGVAALTIGGGAYVLYKRKGAKSAEKES
ncbi:hypothetical protein J7L81_05635 [Candidatus Aerophobetes bacterium]|nr:hypothetical protein [Candidatus Aerophobetes bacterium]